MKTCLLLIDIQESFRQRPYFTPRDLPAYLAAQNALIEGCVARGVPVVRIFHVDGPKTPDNAFAVESGHVRPLDGLALRGGWMSGYEERGATLGAGFAWRGMKLDYAWLPFSNALDDVHRFTFSFAL